MRDAQKAVQYKGNIALQLLLATLFVVVAALSFSCIALGEPAEASDSSDSSIAIEAETEDSSISDDDVAVVEEEESGAVDQENGKGAAEASEEPAAEVIESEAAVLDDSDANAVDQEQESPSVAGNDDSEAVNEEQPAANPKSSAKKAAATDITGVTVKNAVYTGSALTPPVVVTCDSKVLVEGTDYKLTYKNNVNVGTGTVVAKGIGAYSGTIKQPFTIYAKPTYKRGATKMPLYSYSLWTIKNGTLKVVSGNAVKVKGKKVTAVKPGTAKIGVFDKLGTKVATKTVKVFSMSGNFKLRLASSSDLFLEIDGGSKENNGNAIIAKKASVKYQKFKLKAWSDKTYAIISTNSGKYLQVEKGSTSNKANVKQWQKSNKASQHWKIKVDSKNRLIFINKKSKKVLGIIKTTQADGANVLQYAENGRLNQKWVLKGGKRTYTAAATTTASSGSGSEAGMAIAMLAASISYSRVVYQGEGTGTKYYLKICATLASSGYYTKNSKQMQCNVPVAAAVRASGVDSKFPTTNKEIYNYMLKSSAWKCLGNYNKKESMLRPGDILIRIGGVTKYDGGSKTAETNHACIYVGADIAGSVYRNVLKGTDADKGAPISGAVFVSAHTSLKNTAKRSAACLEKASVAYADSRMIVFRYVG